MKRREIPKKPATGTKKQRTAIAVITALMMVFTVMPAAVFAAEVNVKVTLRNNTFTKPLVNDGGEIVTPAWHGTIWKDIELSVGDNETLADALEEYGGKGLVLTDSGYGKYFNSAYGLSSNIGILTKTEWGNFDMSGWQYSVNGVSASGAVNKYVNKQNPQDGEIALNANDKVDIYYSVDGTEFKKSYLPIAPENLKAKVLGYKSVRLTWSSSADADSYEIYRAKQKKGTYKKIGTSTKSTYNDTNAKTGIRYSYRVKAMKGVNGGSMSAAVNARTIPAKTTAKATVGKNKIKISWKKVNDVNGYVVYKAKKRNGAYKAVKTIKRASTKSWTDNGIKKGSRHYYKVKTYKNVSGKKLYSEYSNIVNKRAR